MPVISRVQHFMLHLLVEVVLNVLVNKIKCDYFNIKIKKPLMNKNNKITSSSILKIPVTLCYIPFIPDLLPIKKETILRNINKTSNFQFNQASVNTPNTSDKANETQDQNCNQSASPTKHS